MKLGRLSTMLTSKATAFYQALSLEEQAVAKRILMSLCNLGDGCLDQCRRARKSELVNQDFPNDTIERVLHKLLAARLIVSDKPDFSTQREGRIRATAVWKTHTPQSSNTSLITHRPETSIPSEETIELAHKSLVSDWPILRQWLNTDRNMLRQRRDIEERAWIWHSR